MMAMTPQSIIAKDHNPLDSLFDVDTTVKNERKEPPFVPNRSGFINNRPTTGFRKRKSKLNF
ncbi:TssF [Proteus mirabilis]|uniref:TssF n=1 Tax=Proteus mirabilis TaxID=584 RepID=A0A379FGM3_PROMI|nr:TssF [Proteus mirabilis]